MNSFSPSQNLDIAQTSAVKPTVPVTQEIIDQVNQLMRDGFELKAEQLIPSATLFSDLGLDSLDAVDMLVHIEEKMGVKVDGEKVRGLRTLGDVYAFAAEAAATSKA